MAGVLGVIRIQAQVREQERLPAWLRAAALGLDRDEDCVDLGNGLGVVRLQHPAFLVRVILIEETQADGVLPVGAAAAPGLKDTGLFDTWLLIEIVPIEDERFILGVEDAPKRRLCLARFGDIVDFGNIEVAGADQVPDVAVTIKQLTLLGDLLVFLLNRLIQFVDLSFEFERLLGVLGCLFADQAEPRLQAQRIGPCFGQLPIQVGTVLNTVI